MRKLGLVAVSLVLAVAGVLLVPTRGPRLPPPPRERETSIVIQGRLGARPRLAVAAVPAQGVPCDAPDVAALASEVLRADLAFEQAFDVVERESPRD